MNYRSAPKPAPGEIVIVRHRPMAPRSLALMALAFLAAPGFMLSMAFDQWRGVDVVCERGGAHACDVRSDYGLFRSHRELPIGRIARVVTRAHRDKSTTSFDVAFVLVDGEEVRLARPTTRSAAERLRDDLDRAAKADARGVDSLRTQEPQRGLGLLTAALACGVAMLVFVMLRTADVEVDPNRRTVRYVRRRFPLPAVERTFALADVDGAAVRARLGKKGKFCEGVLVLRREDDLVLVPNLGGDPVRIEASIAELNAALEKARAREA